MSVTQVRDRRRVRGRAPALSLRALGGGPRGAGGGEGDLRAGRDRRALRDLFSREQLEALRDEEQAAGDERERLYRLRKTCEDGIVVAELAERDDELENALLAARVTCQRRGAAASRARRRGSPSSRTTREREELGALQADAPPLQRRRLELIAAREELDAELSGEPDPVARIEEEKGISLRDLERCSPRQRGVDGAGASCASVVRASARARARRRPTSFRTSRRCAGSRRSRRPTRRSAASRSAWSRSRELGFELDERPNIRLDLDDRPQKSPRACVIASDPPKVVHLITRAQGGLHDYQAFMHEAGHALHYAGCDPSLPYTFRKLSRDHALTEIYSYIRRGDHARAGLARPLLRALDEEARENAEATTLPRGAALPPLRGEAPVRARVLVALPEDGGHAGGYAERLTGATGSGTGRTRYLSDMDAGFYSADYLRAWIRSAQLRAYLVREVGEDWWRSPETGDRLRGLFAEGTKPSSEEIAARLGFEPLDTGPLLAELGG